MESHANWQLTEPGGGEFGGCCISATLRDYARLGLFAMSNGTLKNGTNILPDNWMKESTMPSKGYVGYGYFWWLYPGGDYHAAGIYGQGIYVNPMQKIVIALHSAREVAYDPADTALQDAMFRSISAYLGRSEKVAQRD